MDLPARILLVEDEPRLRSTVNRSLSVRGYRISEAASAAEAIASATADHFDLIVLDVNLPDATGWDVLRELRIRGHHVPVIVLSGVPPNPARVREFAPVGILHKPFPIEALIRLVQAGCGERRPAPEEPAAPLAG